MEVTKQTLDQVMLTQTVQPGQVQGQRQTENRGADFDGLLQQKSQETARPAEEQEPGEVQEKEPAQDEAEKPQAQEEEEAPEDAKAVLAAMMLQPQAAQTEEAAAPAQEALLAETARQAPEAVQAVVQEEAPVAAESAPEQAPQTARQAPEAAAQPVQVDAAERYVPTDAPVQAAEETARGAQREAEAPVREVQTRQSGGTEEEPIETPVFEPELESVPVKVAERVLNPEKPVPIESEEAPQAMAEVLTRSVEQGETLGVIQLTPENLGPLTMTVTRDADGVVHMALEALNPKTTALFERHTANIENIAAASLRQEVRVEIKSEQEQPFPENWQDNGKGGRQRQSRPRQKDEEPTEDFMHRLRLGLTGGGDE